MSLRRFPGSYVGSGLRRWILTSPQDHFENELMTKRKLRSEATFNEPSATGLLLIAAGLVRNSCRRRSQILTNSATRLFIAFLCLCVPIVTFAQGPAVPENAARNDRFPSADSGYVTDLAGLIPAGQEEQIEQRLWQTEQKTNVEIIVVTISSMSDYPGTPNDSIESFARGLFNHYAVGNMPDNNGILLVVSRQDRKARIEIGAGYGPARDADARAIMDDVILPEFRDDDYAAGIDNGVAALQREFAGIYPSAGARMVWTIVGLMIAVPALVLIAVSLFKNGKRGWGWVCVGILIVVALALLRLLYEILKAMWESRGRGRSSGWGSGGFGGGFGGGFSSGGGASGSW